MYQIENYKPKIEIKLENGIYIFDNESATGKTRLCNLLKEYAAYGEPVIGISYNDILLGKKLENVLVPNKYKVILLDRYDLYTMKRPFPLFDICAESSIILVDCKGDFLESDNDDWCDIYMSNDRIEVK